MFYGIGSNLVLVLYCYLHNELRERNFQHYVDWSTECFENDCQFVLNKLLDNCGLTEI